MISFRKERTRQRWSSGKVSAGGFQARNPIPLKIRRVLGLLHVKSYVGAKLPPVVVVRKFGKWCHLRCRLRHLTEAQNSEVRPKIALLLRRIQNGTLI
ncbi:hypothetical protein AVEN_127117-1 [Araneus ventricosus]|uniref:Uncharacterized protein n=1 Tax=Araneus ventricosus TaxID=182803 RepID=A0A4Y2GTB5_ARAVE|nr:hypothetical protein AVEN_127117-1 [Araneus ventricosus]